MMILLPPAPNPSTTTQLFSMLFTALGLHRQRMYLHGLCLSVLGLMTQPPKTETAQNKSSTKCYHAHKFPVQRNQQSRTRIGGQCPIPHNPFLLTELRGVAPSFRKAREAEAEPRLSFPAAAELGQLPELPVSSSIQGLVLTARVPRNFPKAVLRLHP